MADKHLNLFYTYNRDNELIENNLTRAFIVFLSILSGETRHRILSTLLKRSRKTADNPVDIDELDFRDARFALQSNIDRGIPKGSDRKLLLTVSTEPLDIVFSTAVPHVEFTAESENDSGSTSVPDAWVYSNTRAYCILIEAKVGLYALNIRQLEAHARDWFGSSLQNLDSRNSLCSVTWLDVLETLKETLGNDPCIDPSEGALLSHLMEFISYYGYRLFEGFDFRGLHASPGLVIGHPAPPDRLAPPESRVLDFTFQQLSSPPEFVLIHSFLGPR